MEFEFDPVKSRSNKEKHGVDFTEAQAMWKDPERLVIRAKTTDEPRYVVLAMMNGKCWAAVITYREERIRIISVRRARKEEVALYESA